MDSVLTTTAYMQTRKIAGAMHGTMPSLIPAGSSEHFMLYHKRSRSKIVDVKRPSDFFYAWETLSGIVSKGQIRIDGQIKPFRLRNSTIYFECQLFNLLSKYFTKPCLARAWNQLFRRGVIKNTDYDKLRAELERMLYSYGVPRAYVQINMSKIAARRSTETFRSGGQTAAMCITVRLGKSVTAKRRECELAIFKVLEKWNAVYRFLYIVDESVKQSNGKDYPIIDGSVIAASNIIRRFSP